MDIANTKIDYEIKCLDKMYKLEIEIFNNEIIFKLSNLNEISFYNYISKYNYEQLIKDLKLNNIEQFLDIKEYDIYDDGQNKILQIRNHLEMIILYKNEIKNDEMMKLMIDEINKQGKEIRELKGTINNLIKENGIKLIYECENDKETNIFGANFVEKNKNNIGKRKRKRRRRN